MGMDMSSMSHGEMQMMHGNMAHGEQKKMPCEKCDHNAEEIVTIAVPSIRIQVSTQSLLSVIPMAFHYRTASHNQPTRLLHAYTRPPPLAESLVGTVILRT